MSDAFSMPDAFTSPDVQPVAVSTTVPATHGGFTFSDAMFYSPFATVPTGGPLDV
ncbi:hypothetical protein SAMN02787144_1019152 [Streptomyces atratus]|uniref:Uncharacterized protein n=1 Tax=Streptomyces atratus TaxID=1893 RepID=A0A1K2EJL1_STRAR|nr:hypothetical protein SAMN02787144_1019152 [Streptomyces atratus]